MDNILIDTLNGNAIGHPNFLKKILDDKTGYFNYFRASLNSKKDSRATYDVNIFNFSTCINMIVNLYKILKKSYKHKNILGGCLVINTHQEGVYISGKTQGHALSYHICTDNEDEFKIILCDPNSLHTCQIVYNILTENINYYNTNGVPSWKQIYFNEISFLLINTDYKPKL